MLLREVILLVHVALQRGEDVPFVEEVITALPLKVEQRVVRDATRIRCLLALLWRDGEVLELLAEDDDRLLGQEWILRRRGPKIGRRRTSIEELLLCRKETRRIARAIELFARMLEEGEDEFKAVGVELIAASASQHARPGSEECGHAHQPHTAPRSHHYLLHQITRRFDDLGRARLERGRAGQIREG